MKIGALSAVMQKRRKAKKKIRLCRKETVGEKSVCTTENSVRGKRAFKHAQHLHMKESSKLRRLRRRRGAGLSTTD